MRLFAAAVGRQAGCDDEVVDDLRLAIDEAVTAPIAAGVSVPIEVHATLAADDVRFEVRSPDAADAPTPDGFPSGDALVRALFADAKVSVEAGTRVLRFGLASRNPA